MPSDEKKFYLTTPIYYVNARPHIGHAYTTIVADVLARRHRLLGDDTFFLTGTDEHGQKIERSAAAAGVAPQQFADEVSDAFQSLWKRMGLTFDKFIRTTDPEHKRGVQKLFSELYERGFIYLASYTGSYCVSDEAFVDAPAGTPCPDCGRLLETVTEENFFFKLSEFQRPLIDLIESDTLAITPETRKNEVLSFLRGNTTPLVIEDEDPFEIAPYSMDGISQSKIAMHLGTGKLARSASGKLYAPGALKDLSISRSSFTWGIPVPDDIQEKEKAKQKHVIYVWLDALANYMTGIGYGSDDPKDEAEFGRFWPADLHLVGKEIIRFHCVYWPAFLLAAGLPLPKAVTAHGWLLFDNAKMSKSKGNIVRAETILEAFGEHVYAKQFPESTKRERDLFAADILRYFLLAEIPFGRDGSFSFDALVRTYTSNLTNAYANTVHRTLSMIHRYRSGLVPGSNQFLTIWPIALSELGLGSSSAGMVDLRDPKQGAITSSSHLFSDRDANREEDRALQQMYLEDFDERHFSRILDSLQSALATVDGLITDSAPWKHAGSEDSDAQRVVNEVLYQAADAIRVITGLLHPFLPSATARAWSQLGLGDIEAAAKRGELNNLHWGDLKPGTKLGPLAPIFPRADKGLAQIMIDMEENNSTTRTRTESPESTDPAAAARTSALDEPSGTPAVGGSSAEKPALPTTPNPPGGAPGLVPPTDETVKPAPITIDDFAKIDLRVAQIVVAERIPKADKLLRLEVDLGYEKRQILSGIAEWYTPEELIGRRIVVITNLAPRKMRGLESHGMLLAASEGEGGKPVLATFGENIALGSRLK